MKFDRLLIFLLVVLLLDSCNQSKYYDVEVEKEEVMLILRTQEKAWNEGNIEEYMNGYWNSDSLRFASGNKVAYGWEKTLNNYKKAYPNKAKMGVLEFTEIDIQVINDKSAIAFGKWKLNRENDEPNGLFTLVFNKKEEGWKIVHDHTSSGK